MARIRMVKPEFFDDPQVGELSPLARLFFIGLWTQADREGRLIDDPRRLKARIFPFDDVDIDELADELHEKDMIRRYKTRQAVERNGETRKDTAFIWIRKFVYHQRPHPKEPQSLIPPCENGAGKKHGEPCLNRPNPSESGVLILDSGVLDTESGERPKTPAAFSSSAPPHQEKQNGNGTVPDELAERAGDFCRLYAELYPKIRKGARYLPKPALDFQKAIELCAVWPDARLEQLATVFLKTDHDFAANGSRTIGQFAALASWCDDRLREVESGGR
jgi:hypothetical protein